jgi:hypothetical protein
MTDEDIKRGKRKIVVLNTANRVFCKVQEVINRDKYARTFTTFYSIATGPNEYIEVIIETPDVANPLAPHHRVMHRWPVQLLLDLVGDADRIIEMKVLQLLQNLFAAANGVTDDEQ